MKGSHEEKEDMKNAFSEPTGKQAEQLKEAISEIGDEIFNKGFSPQQAMGMSSSQTEHIYAQAYRLYNIGKYGEASHLFRILVMINAMETKYMLGLAACHHMMKEYVNAIESYTMCSALDPDNPIPHYHSSDCYLQMKEYLSAMLCLELAIENCGSRQEYSKIKERAQLSLESLKQLALSTPLEEKHYSEKGSLRGIF